MGNSSLVLAVTVALAVMPGQVRAGEPLGDLSDPGVASPRAARLRTIMTLAELPEAGAARLKRPASCDEAEPERGVGMIITGGAFIVPGSVFAFTFGALAKGLSEGFCIDNCEAQEPNPSAGVGLYVLGGVLVAAGVTLLVLGTQRLKHWREWKARQQAFAPSVGRTAFGTWTPGLVLRF